MDDASFVQQAKTIEQLLRKNSHKCRAEAAELVLLDQFVKIDTEEFKD